MASSKVVLHLLIFYQIIAYSLAIGPISQCAGGLFETDLFEIKQGLWSTSDLKFLGDSQLIQTVDNVTNQVTESEIQLLKSTTSSNVGAVSRSAVWYNRLLGVSDRTLIEFTLDLSDIRCGQVSQFCVIIDYSQIQLYPGVFIDDTNDCGPQGFAFVVSQDSIDAIGGFGSGLGYQGVRGIFAVQFDMRIDSIKNDNSNGKAYQISVIQRDISNGSELNSSEVYSVLTNIEPSVNFAIGILPMPVSQMDQNKIQIFVSVNGQDQISGAIVDLAKAGGSSNRLYNYGFTGSNYVNDVSRASGNLKIQKLKISKSKPITTTLNTKVIDYLQQQVLMQLQVSANDSCQAPTSIFTLLGAEFRFDFESGVSTCVKEGSTPIQTRKNLNNRQFSNLIYVKIKCSSSGQVKAKSSYTFQNQSLTLNEDKFVMFQIAKGVFENVFLTIPADLLNGDLFKSQGQVQVQYSFQIDVKNFFGIQKLTTASAVQPLITIEEPRVTYSDQFNNDPNSEVQQKAIYQLKANFTLTSDQPTSSTFKVKFTPKIGGNYSVHSLYFISSPKYQIAVGSSQSVSTQFSVATLITPSLLADFQVPTINAGSQVIIQLTLKNKDGLDISPQTDISPCQFSQSYYAKASNPNQKFNFTLNNQRQLTDNIKVAGVIDLVPRIRCIAQANPVNLPCQQCQIKVLAQSAYTLPQTKFINNRLSSSQPSSTNFPFSIIQGQFFTVLAVMNDQYGNDVTDTSKITILTAKIQSKQGVDLVNLSWRRDSLTQYFVLTIPTAQLPKYNALIPRTGFYKIQLTAESQTAVAKTFDLVPSDFTGPAIGNGSYSVDFTDAILIFPNNAEYLKAGQIGQLYINLRTNNLVQEDQDKSSEITAQFFISSTGFFGGQTFTEVPNQCTSRVQKVSSSRPGNYVIYFSCTTITEKLINLVLNGVTSTLLNRQIICKLSANVDELTLTMSGDAATFYDSDKVFKTSINEVPFQLKDKFNNVYNGEYGKKNIAYEFKNSDGTITIKSSLQSSDGVNYFFKFPYTTPDYGSYSLTFSSQYNAASLSPIVFSFPRTQAAQLELQSSKSTCRLQNVSKDTVLTIGTAPLLVKCVGFTEQNFPAQFGKIPQIKMFAINQDGISSFELIIQQQPGAVVGQVSYRLGASSINKQGIYTISSNSVGIQVYNNIVRVTDTFSLANSKVLRAGSFLAIRTGQDLPTSLNDAPLIYKNLESPIFRVQFYGANNQKVDLSLTNQSIRLSFTVTIKASSDSSSTNLSLDLFVNQGTQLEAALSNSAQNRQLFNNLADGLYYLEIVYIPASESIRAYFQIQDGANQPTGSTIDYTKTLFKTKEFNAIAGIPFDVVFTLRGTDLARATSGLPAINSFTATQTPNTVAAPQLRTVPGPVLGVFIIEVILQTSIQNVTITFTTGANTVGSITAKVSPGILNQLELNGNVDTDIIVGSSKVLTFIPRDFYQNQIKSMYSMSPERIAKLVSINYNSAYETVGRVNSDDRLEIQIKTEVAGTLQFTPFLSTTSNSVNFIAKRIPSNKYSYTQFQTGSITAGAATTLRLFLFDQFKNPITGLTANEINLFTIYLRCIDDQDQYVKRKVLVRQEISGVITPTQVLASSTSSGFLSYQLPSDSYLREACVYQSFTYYKPASQSAQLQKVPCTQCTLKVNHGSLNLAQTLMVDARGVQWGAANNENIDFFISKNVDYLSIPVIFRDQYQNIIPYKNVFASQSQTLTGAFVSGSNQPALCFNKSTHVLEFCDKVADAEKWKTYKAANSDSQLTLTLSESGGTTVQFLTTIAGDDSQDFNSDNFQLNLQNTQINLLQSNCKTESNLINNKVEGEITLRTSTGMRTQTRLPQTDLKSLFKFQSSDPNFKYQILQLMETGKYKFKLSADKARVSSPISLQFVNETSKPYSLNKTLSSISLPRYSKSISQNTNSTSPALFDLVCLAGNTPQKLLLYNFDNKTQPISTTQLLKSASLGQVYQFYVKALDSSDNSIQFNTQSVDLHDVIDIKITYTKDGSLVNSIPYSTTPTQTEDLTLVQFTPTVAASDYRISSPILFVNNATSSVAQTFAPLTSSLGQPQSRRCIIDVNTQHKASTSQALQIWVQVRDAFDNYLNPQSLLRQRRNDFNVQVKWWVSELNDFTDYQDLGDPIVSARPGVLNKQFLKWTITLARVGQTVFRADYRGSNIQCKNCMTLVKVGDLQFSNTLVTYISPITQQQIELKDTLVLNNLAQYPNLRLYPRDQAGNILQNFVNIGGSSITSSINGNVALQANGSRTSSNLVLEVPSGSISSYNSLAQGSYELRIANAFNDQVVTRTLYLLGGNTDGAINAEIDPQLTQINVDDNILDIVAGKQQLLQLTVRVASGQRRNTFNAAENQITFFVQNDSSFTGNYSYTIPQIDIRSSQIAGKFSVNFTPTIATEFAPTNVYLRVRIGPNQTVVNKIKIRLIIHPDIPNSATISSDSIESGTVLKQGNADNGYVFKYRVFDKFNNTISLDSPRLYRYDFSVLRLTQISANINNFVYAKYSLAQDSSTGQIQCSLKFPILASDYKVVSSLFKNNQQYTFKVISGQAAIPYSFGSIPSAVSRKVKAGTQLQFTISARDKNGNPVSRNASGQFQARIITPSGQIKLAQFSQQQSTVSQYSYFYNGTIAGEYKWIPYYALLRMISIANIVVVNPDSLDFGKSGKGIYYYDGNTETSKNYFKPIENKSFQLKVGAAFKLRLDYADKYGNQIDTSSTGLNTTTISFNDGTISGNGISNDIELIGRKINIQGKNWIEYEIKPQRLIDYKLLLAKAAYSVVLKAQDTIQNKELASTTLSLQLISAEGEQKDATNAVADLTKTAVLNIKNTVRAGDKGVFVVEFRSTEGKRSVATPPPISNITVSNPDAADGNQYSYAVTQTQKRGQYKIQLLYTKTKIGSLANSAKEPSDSSSIDFFQAKNFKLQISGTQISGIDINLRVLPGNVDFSKTNVTSKPYGSRQPGLQAIKFLLNDQYGNKFISSSLLFQRLRMFVNDRFYSRKLIISVERDDQGQLGKYVMAFEAFIPPISWNINVYYVQDDFTKTPIYLNSFPTANFTLQSNLQTAQTQYLGVDLTSGISAGKSLELYLLLRDQLGYCFKDDLSIQTFVTGPGRIDPVTDIFIADNGFTNTTATVSSINNQFGDCYRYYKITVPSQTLTNAGLYYIESIQKDAQGGFKQNLGKGRTIQVLQAAVDKTKIRLQFKQSLDLNTAFLLSNGSKLKIRAGDSAQFFINTFDIFGNSIQNERYANFQIAPKNSSKLASNQYKFIVSYQYGNGTYPVTATFSKISGSSGFQFNYKYNGEDITSTINSRNLGPAAFEILPGECIANQILIPDLTNTATFSCREGNQCSFTIQCKDSLGNNLNEGKDQISVAIRSYSLLDKSSGLTGVSLDNTVTDQNNGSYTIIFNPSYAGQYSIIFYVNNVPRDIAVNFNVQRSICAADQIYCYGDKKCAKSFSDCTNQLEKRFEFCKNNPNARGPVYCLVGGLGTCVPSRYDCDVEQNFRKCQVSKTFLPSNQFDQLCYKKFSLDCKSISPSTSFQCNDGTCRQNQNQCPSDHVCPPGTYLCPDFSCTSQLTGNIPQCNYSKVAQPCTFPTPFKCYDSTCAADLASCPTGMTCSNPNHVLCPDNQCVENETKCKILRQCPSGQVKCDDGSCALNYDSCPQRPSCGASKGLCEDYTCRLQCVGIFEQIRLLQQQSSNTSISPATNILTCPGGTIKCPTGECLTSYNLCPSRRVCPPKLIKCSDDSCAVTIDQCLIRTTQGVFNKISCFDGRIVSSLTECPTRVSCPSKYPIKCHDNFCVDNISKCSPYVQCPKQAPFRCWSSDCRASSSDCPSAIHCPKEMPVLCQDGSCHQDSDDCQAIVTQLGSCSPQQIRCSNGVCASAKSLCPSLPTCSGAKPLKCWDGKCVSNLSKCVSPNGQIATCPNPSMKYRCPDSSCVSKIKNCATQLSCPTSTPVRCSDFSCRANASDCPDGTKFIDCPSSDIPCPDGSCSSSNTCSQGVSCPLSAPFLCQDSTCRKDPVDCPKLVTCLAGLFLCKNGKCVNDRRNCPEQQTCPTNKPIRCPDLSCYASISECQTQDFGCPRGFFKCADSSCKEDAQLCSEGTGDGSSTCPRQASFLCPDGNCSFSSEYCSVTTNNCPFYATIKCKSGKCVRTAQECASDNALSNANCLRTGWILCGDGSCAPTASSCPTANGCLTGYKCGNGECAFPQCPVSLCPGDKSFKCPNGVCVTSSRFCLNNISKDEYDYCSQIAAATGQTNLALIPCGNGTCLNNSQMCPALYDCQKGKIRCGDGSCRESELLCPIVGNTCPSHISYRCFNGMCAKDQNSCQTSSGCPASFPTLCPDGQCVTNAQQCDNSVNKQWSYMSNGCPEDKTIKCWNGECVATEAQCSLTNLCPSTLPIKCGIGNCVAKPQDCGDNVECPTGFFRCPDFSCQQNWADCISSIGCPIKTPFRCTDGSCAAVGNALLGNNYCQSGVACSKEKPFRCHNGECKGNSNFCPLSLPFQQCTGQTLTRCNDGSCAKSAQECPSIACPAGAPYLCSDGKCTSSSLQCDDKIICPADQPISCISGICVSNPSFCVPQAIANGSKSTNGDIQGECTSDRPYLCYDGSCMKSSKQCPLIPSCTNVFKPIRCQNGQCVAQISECASSSTLVCAQNFTRCEDGYCRKRCPQYNGCPTNRSFQCQNGYCGIDVSECAAVSNCPYQTPFRCSDFTCKASITQCSLPPFMSKPTKLTITFESIATGTFPLIYSPRTKQLQGELIIPSSSIVPAVRNLQQVAPSFSSNASLNIYPIPDSELSQTFYTVPEQRISDVRKQYTLDSTLQLKFYQIILSAAIQLDVNEQQFSPQFSEPVTLSLFVNIPSHINRLQDICIGQLPKTQQNKYQWQCINRAHSFDAGSSLASFEVSSTGKYAVIYAPNQNFDTSSLYEICGSWSCDAPSDFLLLIFLGPLVIIISLLITYLFLMIMKSKKRMQERLEKAQQGLFYSSDSDFGGGKQEIGDQEQYIIENQVEETISPISKKGGQQTTAYADESALTTEHNLDYSDIRPFVGDRGGRQNKANFNATIPRLYDNTLNKTAKNLQTRFDDEAQNDKNDNDSYYSKSEQQKDELYQATSSQQFQNSNINSKSGEEEGGLDQGRGRALAVQAHPYIDGQSFSKEFDQSYPENNGIQNQSQSEDNYDDDDDKKEGQEDDYDDDLSQSDDMNGKKMKY